MLSTLLPFNPALERAASVRITLTASARSSATLTPFESRWLAEVVRRHEERHGVLEDRTAVRVARTAAPEFEARVLRRAQELGVILRNINDVLTFSPPLVLTTAQADEIVDVVDQAIGDVARTL